jgi:predicted AAA+ superfamily ATPase
MSVSRVLGIPDSSFFLWGCRGTGKSTWLRQRFPNAPWFDFLDEALFHRLLANPGLFAARLRALAPETWVVLDEVQRVPGLLNEVHRAMEAQRLRFVLCGSSARKLKRAGVNLLGGRAVVRRMHPFLPEELGAEFDLESTLRTGLLPLVWDSVDRAERLEAYTHLYLKEEIQAEALVRNLPGFARFLPIAALFHGQVLNVSNIARDAGVARTTVEGYLDILDQTLLTFRLPAYQARLRVRERRLPKLYWTDPGLTRAVKRSFGEVGLEERGALFEGLVAQYLRAAADYYRTGYEVFYWSSGTGRGSEVDFLVKRDERFVAVEVKSGDNFLESWCRGLRTMSELPRLCRRLVVTPTLGPLLTHDGIEVRSFLDFAGLVRSGGLFD